MKSIIDTLVTGVYLFTIAMGGKYSLSYIAHKSKMLAREKVNICPR